MQMGLVLEDQGGDIQAIPISALKGTNLDWFRFGSEYFFDR